MPGLNGILVIGVPVYTVLLTTMAWRAISRVQFYKVWKNLKKSFCLYDVFQYLNFMQLLSLYLVQS